jgi:hypothetical protein
LNVYLLGNDRNTIRNDEKILPFVKISTLVTGNRPRLRGGGGGSLKSKKEFGKQIKGIFVADAGTVLPTEAIKKIEKHTPRFLTQIKCIHDKYIKIINDNQFIQFALDYFYDSETKFVYSDEGFVSSMISLEALFNDGASDIKYKLAHRAAFLLGLAQQSPEDVFEELKRFYDYRSGLIHGNGPTNYDSERYKISHYTRLAIILMLILLQNPKRKAINKNKRKKEIIKEIDYAMLFLQKE